MSAPPPESEPTPEGEQTLLQGVKPVTLRERLQFRTEAPLEPRSLQKRCDHGLFDLNARAQIDLIDELRRLERAIPTPTKEKQA